MEDISNLEIIIGETPKLEKIEIFAQPLVSLQKSSKRNHFEILSRFYNNLGELISPEKIFTSINSCELEKLDEIIFDKSFRILNSLSKKLGDDYLAAINVSEANLVRGNSFLNYIESLREKYSTINSKNIQLELTERGDKCIYEFLRGALDLGYSISVDDLASSNSTILKTRKQILRKVSKEELSRIKLKVDGEIIDNLFNSKYGDSKVDHLILESIIELKNIYPNITIVAEKVEDSVTNNYLIKKGIDYTQGYYFAKPKKLDENYIQPQLKENLFEI